MHEYSFKIMVTDLRTGTVDTSVHKSEDLRQGPRPIGDNLEVKLDRHALTCWGPDLDPEHPVVLRDQETISYPPNGAKPQLEFYLEVSDRYPNSSDDKTRYKYKVCMNCLRWDREEGKRMFSAQTHKYANGSFSQVEEVMRMVASRAKGQTLTLTVVGYCPVHSRICAESSKACLSDYKPRPWLARFRNWWKRQFR